MQGCQLICMFTPVGCHSFDKIAPESLPGKRSAQEVEIFLSEIFSSPS